MKNLATVLYKIINKIVIICRPHSKISRWSVVTFVVARKIINNSLGKNVIRRSINSAHCYSHQIVVWHKNEPQNSGGLTRLDIK